MKTIIKWNVNWNWHFRIGEMCWMTLFIEWMFIRPIVSMELCQPAANQQLICCHIHSILMQVQCIILLNFHIAIITKGMELTPNFFLSRESHFKPSKLLFFFNARIWSNLQVLFVIALLILNSLDLYELKQFTSSTSWADLTKCFVFLLRIIHFNFVVMRMIRCFQHL